MRNPVGLSSQNNINLGVQGGKPQRSEVPDVETLTLADAAWMIMLSTLRRCRLAIRRSRWQGQPSPYSCHLEDLQAFKEGLGFNRKKAIEEGKRVVMVMAELFLTRSWRMELQK